MTKQALFHRLVPAAATLAIGGVIACGATFDPQTRINSVRILGARADKPIAKPGDTVSVEVLSYDGRADKQGRPMKISWVPAVCINPIQDLYYACFSPSTLYSPDGVPFVDPTTARGDVSRADAQAASDAITSIKLTDGASFQFKMPADVISSHPEKPGIDRYGLAVLFNVACAGEPRILPLDPSAGAQQLPFGCFDPAGNKLGPEEFVVGIFRVYSYDTVPDPADPEPDVTKKRKIDKTNTNPVIRSVLKDRVPLDLSQGLTLTACSERKNSDCPATKLDIDVPQESQESYPDQGSFQKEQIYAAYYSTIGDFDDTLKLIYDPASGRIAESDIEVRAPRDPGDGFIFVVVRDNRGGANWVQIPVHVLPQVP